MPQVFSSFKMPPTFISAGSSYSLPDGLVRHPFSKRHSSIEILLWIAVLYPYFLCPFFGNGPTHWRTARSLAGSKILGPNSSSSLFVNAPNITAFSLAIGGPFICFVGGQIEHRCYDTWRKWLQKLKMIYCFYISEFNTRLFIDSIWAESILSVPIARDDSLENCWRKWKFLCCV